MFAGCSVRVIALSGLLLAVLLPLSFYPHRSSGTTNKR